MVLALIWVGVLALVAFWSFAAWALYALTAWALANAGALTGVPGMVDALNLPQWLAPWLPPELAAIFPAMLAAIRPLVDVVIGVAPAMAGGLSVLAWIAWALGSAVILALGVAHWPHFARLVRGAVLVERQKDYVAAARLVGRGPVSIMFGQLLPNVLNPIFVLATLDVAFAIMSEATLSFLGFGMPSTQPSLGTLIKVGYQYLFSGEWWVVVFPGLTLVLLLVSINVFGDWLRDLLDPKIR